MGNGHLNIGTGIGEASAYNPSPAIQQFGNIVAQQRAERQARDKALIDQAAQLKPDLIRDADRPDYINKYNDWKQSAILANNLPQNSRQRLNALMDAQSKYTGLNNFIAESKKEGANEHGLSQQWIGNQHLFSDDAHGKFMKSMQSPMSSSDFVPGNQYQNFERYIDKPKLDEGFDKANKELLKQQDWSNPIQSHAVDKMGNKTGVVVHNEREVSPEDLLAMHAHMATLSPDIQNYLQKQYGNIQGANPHATMMLRLTKNAIDRGDLTLDKNGQLQTAVNEATKPEFKPNYAPDRFYAHYDYRLANPAGANQITPAQKLVNDMKNQVPGSGEKLISMIPKGQYGNHQPTVGINPTTGEHEFSFPAQVEVDKKAIETNNALRAGWKADNQKPDPSQLLPEQKIVKPAKTYRLNPNSDKYFADMAQLAADQNINLSRLNQIEGIKGGHGQIPQVTQPSAAKPPATTPKIKGTTQRLY